MKSYILAIVLTMFLSALFAFQNIGDVTIRFLIFEWTLPQGVWAVSYTHLTLPTNSLV